MGKSQALCGLLQGFLRLGWTQERGGVTATIIEFVGLLFLPIFRVHSRS